MKEKRCQYAFDTYTEIYASFNGHSPAGHLVEINVRPACITAKRPGVNYITVSGFEMCHAATNWSPPTSGQTGLVCVNWCKGWVIENNRIKAAACILPLPRHTFVDTSLGTRHRAAVGMSEVSDAIIVVISEQTGTISVASDGTLTREYSLMGLRNVLKDKLIGRRDIDLDSIA